MSQELVEAPADESGLIANCPFCNYSVRGLPIEHRCPECGEAVCRDWNILGRVCGRGGRNTPFHIRLMIAQLTIAVSGAIVISIMAAPCCALAPLLIALEASVYLYRGRPRFVAVNPSGIVVVERGGPLCRFSWWEITAFRSDDVWLRFRAAEQENSIWLPRYYSILDNPTPRARLGEFARQATAYAAAQTRTGR
ncbi:MAG: hypothetical protein SF069_12490 [Phycisphaerae bacterium]|nr:hypothetical protein [Phycisphaerae bacterium]